MRRREFLKWLGWGPVVAVVTVVGWKSRPKTLGWLPDTKPIQHLAETPSYLCSDTEWNLNKQTASIYGYTMGDDGIFRPLRIRTRGWRRSFGDVIL